MRAVVAFRVIDRGMEVVQVGESFLDAARNDDGSNDDESVSG